MWPYFFQSYAGGNLVLHAGLLYMCVIVGIAVMRKGQGYPANKSKQNSWLSFFVFLDALSKGLKVMKAN